jgi:uncharacterized protein (TIGR02391 family)
LNYFPVKKAEGKVNLETKIDESLWNAIQASYSAKNYTSAILDAIFYLSNVIRERTGLESDGVALAGSAFGGKNPKLKVNKLQTESDWNVQKGVEQLLRGLYQGIRNPRSHEKHNDNQEDADSIILFTSYLIKIIVQSKPPFTKQDLLKRVFDPYFPDNDRYSELLVSQIPAKYKLEILIDAFREKSKGDAKKLRIFFNTLLAKLSSEETKQLVSVISEELEQVTEESEIRETIQVLPESFWLKLDETARIRTEHILIKSIESGQYDSVNGRCLSGALGAWCHTLIQQFLSRDIVLVQLLTKLASGDHLQEDYVFQFFFSRIFKLAEDNNYLRDYVVTTVINGLKNGDIRFYNALRGIMSSRRNIFAEKFKEAYDNFKEQELAGPDEDDLPF